jgi:hypothetical protein
MDDFASKQHKTFVRRCPANGCRGFLSTAWKCGVCELYSCSECHEVKGVARDSQHICDENNIETAKLLAKDTKPCPKCGEMITKIDGCDQMWCISCHTAFSWKSGQVVVGTVHNPHYYEWQRLQNNGEAPRVNGDIPCGGLIEWPEIRNAVVGKSSIYPAWVQIFELAHRRINHVMNIDMVALNHDVVNDNIDLRIRYLLNEIDDETMKSTLVIREQKYERDRELRRIYETLTVAAIDIFRKVVMIGKENKERSYLHFKPVLSELEMLRNFINDAIDSLRRRYTATIRGFDKNWERLKLIKKHNINDIEKSEQEQQKTIYGKFVDELAKFKKMEIIVPKDYEDGKLKAKPFLSKLSRLRIILAKFPNSPIKETATIAEKLITYYYHDINYRIIYTSGTRADPFHREYEKRCRDRHTKSPVEHWDEHVKTLELTFSNPINEIITT